LFFIHLIKTEGVKVSSMSSLIMLWMNCSTDFRALKLCINYGLKTILTPKLKKVNTLGSGAY